MMHAFLFVVSIVVAGCASTDEAGEGNNYDYNNNSNLEENDLGEGENNYGGNNGQYEQANQFNQNDANGYENDGDQVNNSALIQNSENSGFDNSNIIGTNPADELLADNLAEETNAVLAQDDPEPVEDSNQIATPAADGEMDGVVEEKPSEETDILPMLGTVWWVSYDYNKREKTLKIQVLTKGRPEFDVIQEKNQAEQPEIVLRFYGAGLRPKMKRAIDASEFLSPVSYVRTRENPAFNSVDVVLTLREAQRPKLFSKRGNVQLLFSLSGRYLDGDEVDLVEGTEVASLEVRSSEPEVMEGSDLPRSVKLAKAYVPDPVGNTFDEDTENDEGEFQPSGVANNSSVIDSDGLPPENFSLDTDAGASSDPIGNAGEGADASEANELFENQGSSTLVGEGAYLVEEFNIFAVAQDDGGFSLDDGYDNSANIVNDSLELSNNVVEPESVATTEDIVGSAEETIAANYTGRPIMLEFFAAPLSEVLKAFSDQVGTNFIYPPSVGTTQVTIKLQNVPWDAALNAILETYGLGMTKVSNNIIRVDSVANMNSYLQQRDQANFVKKLSEERKIVVVRVSNANVNDLVSQLQNFFSMNGVDNRTQISTDPRTNSIFIEAPPFILAKAKSLIQRLDVQVPQVEIMSRLIEVRRSVSNFLGISWNGGFNFDGNAGLGFGSLNAPNSAGSSFSVDPGVGSGPSVGAINFNVGSINDFIDLSLRLRMEESRGTTEILQTSRVVVHDQMPASIRAGTNAIFPTFPAPQFVQAGNQNEEGETGTTDASGAQVSPTSVQFSLSLSVTPRVTNEGHVFMDVNLESSTPEPATMTGSVAAASVRSLQTQMLKASGQTAVIGGIYDTKKVKQQIGIPGLSSLPIIGALFRSKGYAESQTELMMLITPTILGREGEKLVTDEPSPVYESGVNATGVGNGLQANANQYQYQYENNNSGLNTAANSTNAVGENPVANSNNYEYEEEGVQAEPVGNNEYQSNGYENEDYDNSNYDNENISNGDQQEASNENVL